MRPMTKGTLPANPMNDPEILLMHLERIGRCNKAWADYVESRAAEVQDGIDRLCQFADLQEGLVANIVTSHAIALQVRLDEVLERHRNPEEGQTDE
ncbi:MAG: hypothetical protein KAY24_00295 [Candidatus Eisenbacteria sp.]|nr:hypothetical protein [Candidatus Eisenbacteria bacterium]